MGRDEVTKKCFCCHKEVKEYTIIDGRIVCSKCNHLMKEIKEDNLSI